MRPGRVRRENIDVWVDYYIQYPDTVEDMPDSDASVGVTVDSNYITRLEVYDNLIAFIQANSTVVDGVLQPCTSYPYSITKTPLHNNEITKTVALEAGTIYTVGANGVVNVRDYSLDWVDENLCDEYLENVQSTSSGVEFTCIKDCYLNYNNYRPLDHMLVVGEKVVDSTYQRLNFNGVFTTKANTFDVITTKLEDF